MRWYLLWLIPFLALAHGGEDHGDNTSAPLSTTNGAIASATGSVFEVVLKAAEITPGEASSVRVLVSDVETNTPIKEASIEISMKSASARLFTGKATPTKADGIYEFSTTFPAVGVYSFDLTVQAKGRADLLALSGFEVKSLALTLSGSSALPLPLLLGGGLGIFFVAVMLGFSLGRRRSSKEVASAVEKT
jgi:hypothetical protein